MWFIGLDVRQDEAITSHDAVQRLHTRGFCYPCLWAASRVPREIVFFSSFGKHLVLFTGPFFFDVWLGSYGRA